MKKFVSILLCLVMVLGLLPMAAFAAGEDVTILVEANKKEGLKPGDTIIYTVSLAPVTTMAAADFTLVIPEGLELGTVTAGAALPQMQGNGFVEIDGYINFSCYGGMNSYTSAEKTVLGTFECTVKADTKGDQVIVLDTEYPPAFGGLNNQTYTYTMNADTVNVPKSTYVTPYALTVSYDTLAITDATKKTVAPSFSAKDAENDTIALGEKATVAYAFKGTAPAGLSIDAETGVVTVSDAAAVAVGDSTVTVTATLTATGNTGTQDATITVTKAAPAAASVMPAANNPTTALIPADKDSETYEYKVDVKDQYGAAMDAAVTWTNSTLPTGVNFDATTATLTVTKDAVEGEVTLTATVGDKEPVTIKVNVTSISFTGVDAGITAKNGVYGDKLSDLVKIDADSLKAEAGGTVAGTYELVDADTVPNAGSVDYKVTFKSDDGKYTDVLVKAGTITVAKKPVTIKANDVVLYVGADVAEAEYGYTFTALVGEDELAGTATYATYAMNEDGTKGEAATVSTAEPADYIIEVSGLTPPSENYELTFEAGELNVKKKSSLLPAFGTNVKPGEEAGQKEPVVELDKFEDVAEEDWFYDAVEFVVSKGLFKGTSETTFAPNANMTRAMVATVIFRLDGAKKGDVEAAFEDVADGTWYADGVAWAADKGVVKGISETVFAPDDNVTREQLAAMLYRYVGEPEMDAEMGMAGFNDVDAISDWAADAMRWAVQNGILKGKDGGMLDPTGNATRAEVATMLQRFVKLEK